MREYFTQKEMLDHVGKLQDRERQKITSMGLSNWVLFVTIATLSYFLFPGINLMRANLSYTILSYVLFLNLAIALFDIFNSRFRQTKIGVFRKLSESGNMANSQVILRDFEFLLVFISFILNVAVTFMYPIYIVVLSPFIYRNFWNLFGIVYSSSKWLPNIWGKLIGFEQEDVSLNTEEIKINDDQLGNTEAKKYSKWKFFLLFLSIVPFLYNFLMDNLTDLDLKLNLYGFILVLITLLIQFLFVIFSKRMKIGWLESFEREIIQNNLSASTIRSRLTKEYYNLSNIDDYF
ncbi:hypothetical protein [Paenibacillus sp. TC-CSREp1]|uniref:hypothetical protein n=1 Tax=Paenibacillus sp. TC-CSREp1 TaxID=3410089 RepID=UPI003D066354